MPYGEDEGVGGSLTVPDTEESPLSMSKAAVRNPRGLAMQQKRHSPTIGMIVKDVTSVEDLMKRVPLPEQFQVTA